MYPAPTEVALIRQVPGICEGLSQPLYIYDADVPLRAEDADSRCVSLATKDEPRASRGRESINDEDQQSDGSRAAQGPAGGARCAIAISPAPPR